MLPWRRKELLPNLRLRHKIHRPSNRLLNLQRATRSRPHPRLRHPFLPPPPLLLSGPLPAPPFLLRTM